MSRLGWTESVCLACYCVQSHTCVLYARMPSVHSGSFIFPAVNQAGKKKKKVWSVCHLEQMFSWIKLSSSDRMQQRHTTSTTTKPFPPADLSAPQNTHEPLQPMCVHVFSPACYMDVVCIPRCTVCFGRQDICFTITVKCVPSFKAHKRTINKIIWVIYDSKSDQNFLSEYFC